MHNFSENPDVIAEEPVDRTKWIWLGIIGLIVLSVGIIWATNQKPNVSLVRAKHILIRCNQSDSSDRTRALEEITELRERIVNGEKFETLAKEYSNDDHSSLRGGDLGYYKRGSFEGEFEEYVWSAPVGELSEILKTNNGFHIAVVTDRWLSDLDQYEVKLKQKVLDEEPKTAEQ